MKAKYIVPPKDRILVTGDNGFIEAKVVEQLLECGFPNLLCFVRPFSRSCIASRASEVRSERYNASAFSDR